MKTRLLPAVLVGCTVLGIGFGVLIGRAFPAHRYERIGESWYLLDTATGRICNVSIDPNKPANLIDQTLKNNKGNSDENLLVPNQAPYPPPCMQMKAN
jgi:hypothetical protein